jgi:hypothetical protein
LERKEEEREKENIKLKEEKKKEDITIIIKQKNTWENVRELTKVLSIYVVSIFLMSNKQLTT